MDADAANRNQRADLYGGLDIQLVGGILEDLQDIYVVRPLRRGGEPQRELRLEIGQNLLICICGGVVRLVDDQIVKSVLPELIQIESHALDAAAHHMGVRLFEIVRELTDSHLRPQVVEGIVGLVDQLHRMRHEQHPPAATLRVHDCSYGLACTGSMIEKRDGLPVLPHGFQRIQRLLLILPQLQLIGFYRAALLGRQIVLNLLEPRISAQEHAQLVLYGFRLLLHLPNCPAVNVPAQVDHAVLFQQIVIELVLRHQTRIVGGLIVDLNGNAGRPVFQHEVGKAGILINVVKRVL